MVRLGVAFIWLAIWGTAHAQPAPRVTLDVELPPADVSLFNAQRETGRLAVGRDGVHYVLQQPLSKRAADSSGPATSQGIELLAVGPDGSMRRRLPLPVRMPSGFDRFIFSAYGVIAARSGDLAVFMCPLYGSEKEGEMRADATLFRIARDLTIKKTARLPPPGARGWRDEGGAYYSLTVYVPTADNAIVLGGGFGLGPYPWWMGKFSLDGVRLWEAGMAPGFPETVAAIRQRPDGTLLSVVYERNQRTTKLDWVLRRYTADGRLLSRTRLPVTASIAAAAILHDSIVVIADGDRRERQTDLIVFDDSGGILRRAPWPHGGTRSVIEDGDGIAAITVDDQGGHVVRTDTRGVIRWRSAAANVVEIVRTPDGQIAALVHEPAEGRPERLMRFADP